jgi:hypothetical protein
MDLAGGGLQAANIRLAAQLKRKWLAYALLALFPLGLHRYYLRDRWGPQLYGLGTLAVTILLVMGEFSAMLFVAVPMIAAAGFDIFWIEQRLAQVNKQIRKAVYLGHAATPPAGYQGRVTQDMPASSFAEQERRLAEITRRNKAQGEG